MQHYGLTESATVIEARAAKVLDFLIRFLDAELLPRLGEDKKARLQPDLELIRLGLTGIQGFVTHRLERIAPDLELHKARTLHCPDCRQWALVADEGTECRFCGRRRPSEDAAEEYMLEIQPLSQPWELLAPSLCTNCEVNALVPLALIADAPEHPVGFCFNCTEKFANDCTRCGRPFQGSDEDFTCGECFAELVG